LTINEVSKKLNRDLGCIMMIHISKRSLKASESGVQLASRAILRFPTKIDFAVELEISRSTVQNFFAGKPVGRENFHKICQELNLSWQEVAELPQELPKSVVINRTEIDHQEELNHCQELATESFELTTNEEVDKFRMQVKSRILSMCGMMRVLDMSFPMPVENIYVNTQVYEKIKGQRRLKVNQIDSSYIDDNGQINQETTLQKNCGLAAARRYDKLIVLGKPGSGKTMFLKSLALRCSKGIFEPERIPIFVPLRDFSAGNSSLNLMNYIALQLTLSGKPIEIETIRQLLNQGKFFIVIDGLDEVNLSVRRDFSKHLKRFTEWFPSNRYIVSCRHGVECCNFEQFTEIEIADFQSEQIADFAIKWFDNEYSCVSKDFLDKLKQSNSIQQFSTNPLLLTLLCIQFDESADFPSSRSEIYEEGLDIMLKQWDAERSIERETGNNLSLEQEKELLCAIALRTFERKQHFIKEADLKFYIVNYVINLANADISKINAKKVLKSLEAKHGLIVEQAKKVYSFSHLTFQEYLTARKFVFEYDLTVSTVMLNHLVKHMAEERWGEIFLLVAEMSPQADNLFQIMHQQLDSYITKASDIKVFLDWVNCKANSLLSNDSFDLATIRAFYFSLGFSQVMGCIGSNFDLVLKLDPSFSKTINSNFDLALDLSLFHISNLTHNLEAIQRPALTFRRNLNRAIAHAAQIQSELAEELRQIAEQLPHPEENTIQFWRWWHQQGITWSNRINSVAAQYRNMGYQWQLDSKQQKSLEQYKRANILMLDCLNSSSGVSLRVRQTILAQLLTSTKIDRAKPQEIELMLRQNIA
jgi:predicted NACHT family NTPase